MGSLVLWCLLVCVCLLAGLVGWFRCVWMCVWICFLDVCEFGCGDVCVCKFGCGCVRIWVWICVNFVVFVCEFGCGCVCVWIIVCLYVNLVMFVYKFGCIYLWVSQHAILNACAHKPTFPRPCACVNVLGPNLSFPSLLRSPCNYLRQFFSAWIIPEAICSASNHSVFAGDWPSPFDQWHTRGDSNPDNRWARRGGSSEIRETGIGNR